MLWGLNFAWVNKVGVGRCEHDDHACARWQSTQSMVQGMQVPGISLDPS